MMQEMGMDFSQIEEIALRAGQPVIILAQQKEYYLGPCGTVRKKEDAVCASQSEITALLQIAGEYSLYAFEEEIKYGYLTVQGGHRIGICGRVVVKDGQIVRITHVNSINIRIAHEAKGCAKEVYEHLYENGRLMNTLIVSPPGCGKTTLLRECIRLISDGTGMHRPKRVSVIDERCEIAASYRGSPSNNVGMRTSILEGVRKSDGIELVLRAMSPQVIAVDEIGGKEDAKALLHAAYGGCVLFATAHGGSFADLTCRPGIRRLFKESIFERYVFIRMDAGGKRQYEIYDKERKCC
jgi:stage III sporulation protein AA